MPRTVLLACVLLSTAVLLSGALVRVHGFSTFPTDNHKIITDNALYFLRDDVREDITNEGIDEDLGAAYSPSVHFDSCFFFESSTHIRAEETDALTQLDPSTITDRFWDVTDQWGQALHTTQDFYSHSNWVNWQKILVDNGQLSSFQEAPLVETSLGEWPGFQPYEIHQIGPPGAVVFEQVVLGGVPQTIAFNGTFAIIAQGEDETPFGPGSFYIQGADLGQAAVFTGSSAVPPGLMPNSYYPAIITGFFGPFGLGNDDCPDSIDVSHGDLNKDKEGIDLFPEAALMAGRQTFHEWCRLLNLANSKYGVAGSAILMGLFTQETPPPCIETPLGSTQVNVSVNSITVKENEDFASAEANFALTLYSSDFSKSVTTEIAQSISIDDNSPVPANKIPGPLSLCLGPSETIVGTLQGWDDDGGTDKVLDDYVADPDDVYRGVTFEKAGPGFGAGTNITDSTSNLQVTFAVSTSPPTTCLPGAFDFTISASPSDSTILSGGSASYNLVLTVISGSAVPVTLSGSGFPSGGTLTFSPDTVTPTVVGTTSTLNVSTSNPGGLGDFVLTLQGQGGGKTHTANVNLHIYDFTVTASPASFQVLTTGSNTYSVTVALAPGSSTTGLPTIALTLTGLPAGATGSFNPGNGTPSFVSTLTISTSSAPSGSYVLTIMGTDSHNPGGGTRTSSPTLVVLTPQQALQLIINQVNGLKASGTLTSGQANSLVKKLNMAISSLNLKPPGKAAACNQLNAFINQVDSLVAEGVLTQAQANLLLGGPLGILAIMTAIPC